MGKDWSWEQKNPVSRSIQFDKNLQCKKKKKKPKKEIVRKNNKYKPLIIMIRDYTMILYRGNMCATPAESSKRVCFSAV